MKDWLRKTKRSPLFLISYIVLAYFLLDISTIIPYNRTLSYVFLHHILPFFSVILLILYTNTEKLRRPDKIFSWKTWLYPSLFVITFSINQWKFNANLGAQANFFGQEWAWWAILEYTALFISTLYLYQKKLPATISFTFSFLSIFLAGLLYELPWYYANHKLADLPFEINYTFSILAFSTFLIAYGFKPTKPFLFSFIPLILFWLLYWNFPPWLYWIHRLGTFPLFLTIPHTLKKQVA